MDKMSAFLLALQIATRFGVASLQIAVWKTRLLWPSPKVILSSSNIPKVQGIRHESNFVHGCSAAF